MYNYISTYDDSFFVIDNKKIIKITKKEIKSFDHKKKIMIIEGNVFVDEQKCVYRITDEEIKLVTQVEKSASKMTFYNQEVFLADRFGDVIKICSNDKKDLVLGSMCYNTGICVFNNQIVICDKYGRIRVNDLNGRILFYVFLDDKPILSMCLCKNIVVATKTKVFFFNDKFEIKKEFPVDEIRKIVKFDDESVLVLGKESKIINEKEEVLCFDYAFDAAALNGEIVYIDSDKNLKMGGQVLMKLEDDYENYLSNLQY